MALRLALLHQTWDSFSCFNVSKSTTRRPRAESEQGKRETSTDKAKQGTPSPLEVRVGPCTRRPELLQDFRYGSELKAAKIREVASAGTRGLSI